MVGLVDYRDPWSYPVGWRHWPSRVGSCVGQDGIDGHPTGPFFTGYAVKLRKLPV